MSPIFVEFPPSNGGALFLAGITVVGSQAIGESIFPGEDFEILIWSIIDEIIDVRSYVSFLIFSSEFCLLDSIVACMASN